MPRSSGNSRRDPGRSRQPKAGGASALETPVASAAVRSLASSLSGLWGSLRRFPMAGTAAAAGSFGASAGSLSGRAGTKPGSFLMAGFDRLGMADVAGRIAPTHGYLERASQSGFHVTVVRNRGCVVVLGFHPPGHQSWI